MNFLKNWLMIVLTTVFLLLYTVSLLGWLKPLSDVESVRRYEPFIFLILGYYLSRLPSHQNELFLKDEISRQISMVDEGHHSLNRVQKEKEALEERLKNVKTILMPSLNTGSTKTINDENLKSSYTSNLEAIKAATNILNS